MQRKFGFLGLLRSCVWTALLVGFLASASAQQMSCTYGSVFPAVRAEGFAEILGDITIDCTGGTATIAGQSIPRVNITVYISNANITSKITDNSANTPPFNEALLMIDDPNRGGVNNGVEVFTHPILACGATGGATSAPYISGQTGSCDILAVSSAADTYNGASGRPNVFQGRQVPGSSNAVSFLGVPIDPPGPLRHRLIRITNLRANIVGITGGVAGGGFGSQTVQANVITDPSVTLPSNQFPLNVAVAQQGLFNVTATSVESWPQCTTGTPSGGSLTLHEGFAGAFKVRNWAQTQSNGAYVGQQGWSYTGGSTPTLNSVDLNQNVPGVYYGTESAIMFPSPTSTGDPIVNPPSGVSITPGTASSLSQHFGQTVIDTGLASVGRAASGTRFRLVFSSIPLGSNATVPTVVPLIRPSNSVQTGVMVYVAGADANGAGGALSLTGPGGGSVVPLAEPGPTAVIYEVIFSDYTSLESATVPVTLHITPNLGANPPLPQAGVTASASVGFAPFYSGATGGSNNLPLPRFIDLTRPETTVSLWTFHSCGPDLTVTKVHSGDFSQGGIGTYTLTVRNSGNSPTSGAVTVQDVLPSGFSHILSAASISGAGWTCALGTLSCTRVDVLAVSTNYPPVTVTINLATTGYGPINFNNTANVSGGSETNLTNNQALDPTTIIAGSTLAPDLAIFKTHTANFHSGQIGAAYNIVVVNGGGAATSGTVTVTDTLPAGLVPTGMVGPGWTCVQPAGPCTRSDALLPGSVYPTIVLTVNVSAGAPALFSNQVRVSGSGELITSNNTFTDVTTNVVSATQPGVFRSGFFWLQDVNGDKLFAAPPDRAFAFGGVAGDVPITGDWNGSGTTKVGVYRPANGLFILDYDGDGAFTAADKAYNLGVGVEAGDKAVVGDWNGDGKAKVGLFRQGFFWILDYNGNGVFEQALDKTYAFGGVAGDIPVVGDWNGSGVTKIGLFRLGFYWILDANGNGSLDNINGVGGDQAFAYGGIANDVPVVGDWNGSGTSKVGVFRQGFFWVLDANGNRTFDGTGNGQDFAFPFGGIAGDKPVVGKW